VTVLVLFFLVELRRSDVGRGNGWQGERGDVVGGGAAMGIDSRCAT
jgi:hypothetical protein